VKSEATMKKYVCNGKVFDTEDTSVFEKISGSPIYEVVRVVGGKPIFLEDHLERMFKSGHLIGYDIGFTEEEISEFANICIKENEIKDNNIKFISVEDDYGEKLMIVLASESFYPPSSYYEEGIRTVILEHERDNPNVKIQHGDYKEKVKKAIESTGSFEVLLKNSHGYILEGSRSNLFYILEGKIFTAPSSDVLLGITRRHIIKLCMDLGYSFEERKLHVDELKDVQALFISGTSVGILPVSLVDNLEIPSASNGIIEKLLKAYDEMIHKTLE
jgi:branched-chain amino acid aminotransferase